MKCWIFCVPEIREPESARQAPLFRVEIWHFQRISRIFPFMHVVDFIFVGIIRQGITRYMDSFVLPPTFADSEKYING